MGWKNNYSLFFVSIIIVTGPSFIKETFISAPNSPDWTAFEIAEKTRIAEAKNAESEKIKSATSALADAFGGFGSKPDTGAH